MHAMCHTASRTSASVALVVAAIALLATGFLPSATAVAQDDALATIGERLEAILAPLDRIESDPSKARARLETAHVALTKLRADLAPLYRDPKTRAAAQRAALHLGHLVKWTEFLLRKRGLDPGATPRRAARTRGVQLLREAERFAKEQPRDRLGIAQRFAAALEALRGEPEERAIVERLNALWDEVSDGSSVPEPTPGPGSTDPGDPGSTGPGPAAQGPSKPDPAPSTDEPLDAETLKTVRTTLIRGEVDERVTAARTLGHQKASWLGGFLVDRLRVEKEPAVRAALDEAVRRVADRHVARALSRWSRLDDVEMRKQAMRLLGAVDHDEAGKSLRAFAKEKVLGAQRVLLDVAKAMPEGRGVPAIARLIDDRPSIRAEAITALGACGHEEAATVLVSFLHRKRFDDEKPLAIRAFQALGPIAVPTLIRALEATDYRQHAADALRRVTGQRFGISSTKWKQWWRKNGKRLLEEKR